jgi:hypothetical protein
MTETLFYKRTKVNFDKQIAALNCIGYLSVFVHCSTRQLGMR